MRISLEISRTKKTTPSTAAAASGVEQKTLTWEKLWGAAREFMMFSKGRVTKPYAQVPSVYKAVKAISDNVPQAQMGIYRWENDEEIQEAENPVLELLNQPRRTGKKQSGNDFMQELCGYYALNNEVFIRMVGGIGNMAGTRTLPAELWVLNPEKMRENIDKGTDIITSWRYGRETIPAEEIIHIKDFNPYDEHRSLSPNEPLGNEMNLDRLASIYNMAFFENDATPNAVLTSSEPMSKQSRDRLKAWIEKRHQGAQNKHKMDVLEGGVDIKTIAQTHSDMEFIDQRRFSREEILGAFRAPKALFNITEDLNYATFQGQMKIFWLYAIMPILRKVEDAININLIWPSDRKIYFAFNIKNVPAFQDDFDGKVITAKTLFDMGFTANEINQKLGLGFDEEDWRDYWWIGFNLMPADQILDGGGYFQDPGATDDPGKQPDKEKPKKAAEPPKKDDPDILGWHTWKAFVARQAPAERLMERKLSRFFYEQRSRMLSAINEQNMRQGPDLLNWDKENGELRRHTQPIMEQAVNHGVDHARELVGKKSLENLEVRLRAYIDARMSAIVGMNNTTKKLLRKAIDQAIEKGATIQQITDLIKEKYNLMAARAKLIARTETAGAVNGGSKIYYEDVGVPKKRWVTAGDEVVRESHRACGRQGSVKMDAAFVNGCRYPGDQEVNDPGEVCNCRCTIVPILE